MFRSVFGYPGKLADYSVEAAVIAANLGRQLATWTVSINRLGILGFAERRYPKLFRELDGGDKRILRAFLDPEPISNTTSLLGGLPGKNAEFFLSPRPLVKLAQDACGTEAAFDNSFVEREDGADAGAERWFFINGIATSRDLARLNVKQLSGMFGSPFTLIHNPTQGLINDLVESAMQKFTNLNTEPVARAFLEIAGALLDESVEHVVVVAHSQGTIVMGDVLDLIYLAIDKRWFDRTNLDDQDLKNFVSLSSGTVKAAEIRHAIAKLKNRRDVLDKLELYMFANAASRMCYTDRERKIPHIESFANEHDIVTRLGVLARDAFHAEDLLRIDGSLFTRNRSGHLLNAHYLPDFARGRYKLQGKAPKNQESVGTSVHDAVRGNPCMQHPLHVPGPSRSRLLERYERARRGEKPSYIGAAESDEAEYASTLKCAE